MRKNKVGFIESPGELGARIDDNGRVRLEMSHGVMRRINSAPMRAGTINGILNGIIGFPLLFVGGALVRSAQDGWTLNANVLGFALLFAGIGALVAFFLVGVFKTPAVFTEDYAIEAADGVVIPLRSSVDDDYAGDYEYAYAKLIGPMAKDCAIVDKSWLFIPRRNDSIGYSADDVMGTVPAKA